MWSCCGVIRGVVKGWDHQGEWSSGGVIRVSGQGVGPSGEWSRAASTGVVKGGVTRGEGADGGERQGRAMTE